MQILQCWANTEASKTRLPCFQLSNLLQLVTDLTHRTEESNEHPRSHPWNTPAVTQSWHPRKMVLKLKKLEEKKAGGTRGLAEMTYARN